MNIRENPQHNPENPTTPGYSTNPENTIPLANYPRNPENMTFANYPNPANPIIGNYPGSPGNPIIANYTRNPENPTIPASANANKTLRDFMQLEKLQKISILLIALETIFGGSCLAILVKETATDFGACGDYEAIFFLLVTFAFLVTTFIILICSPLPVSRFEIVYHSFAFIFYCIATFAFLLMLFRGSIADFFCLGFGVGNCMLYFGSAYLSFKAYRSA